MVMIGCPSVLVHQLIIKWDQFDHHGHIHHDGDIVDDDALIDALNRRKIYAVGLDVYKNEPNLNPGYLKIKSAFVLPHLGSATKDTRTAMANLAIDNIDEFFNTGNCKNKVN